MYAETAVAPALSSVAPARHWVRDRLTEAGLTDGPVDTVVLLVSELVTNAVAHARPPVVLRMHVDGQQYVWAFQYPSAQKSVRTYSDMVVPVGMTVILDITADDVAHSWWIPKLGGKMDAIPGYHNKSWFQIPSKNLTSGGDRGKYQGFNAVIYSGQCAELCGRNHANMLARVIGLSPQDFDTWVNRKAQEIKTAQTDVAKQHEELQKQQSEGQTP